MSSLGTVYLVHAVDTEGPLHEDLQATFERLKDRFGIQLEASLSNLERLRNKEIDLGGREEAVSQHVMPSQLDRYLGSWDAISEMHEVVMDSDWRRRLADSIGEPYVISWFCMDHVNYNNNPRRRAMGYHAVFDYYTQLLRDYDCPRDRIDFHYHPPAPTRDAHCMGRGFAMPMQTQEEIVARRIIDRNWMPVANRPGGHHEAYDVNVWLEAWIPFDLANQNMEFDEGRVEFEKSGLLPGHVSDWRGAPTDWRVYHPDLHDYRVVGNLKRWMGRCLNMSARHSLVNEAELEKAFLAASMGEDVLVSVTNHDFRHMVQEIENYVGMVRSAASRFPDVCYRWANTVEAFRATTKMVRKPAPELSFDLNDRYLKIVSDSQVWGSQPFLAVRTPDGQYYRLNMIADSATEWSIPWDSETTTLDAVAHLGVGFNDHVGNSTVASCHVAAHGGWEVKKLNDSDWID